MPSLVNFGTFELYVWNFWILVILKYWSLDKFHFWNFKKIIRNIRAMMNFIFGTLRMSECLNLKYN